MRNQGDVQYTSNVTIGGQSFEALIDTGSFEMLVFSQHCKACGDHWSLYNDTSSSTYTPGKIHTDHGFGSGTTWSLSAFDDVSVGPLASKHQLFWEVYDADMPLLEQGSPFQILIGVGPPQSAVKMAIEARDSVRDEVKERISQGVGVEKDDQEIVDQYEKTAELAQNTTSFLGKLGLDIYSFCFLKPSGWGGYFVLNDKDPEEETRAAMFTKIPVNGDLYWSAAMTDVQLGLGPGAEDKTALGCHGEVCSAVIDTGTSLILAPSAAVEKVDAALDKWLKVSGNCSDLSLFPDFEFKLANQTFSLPPEAYIGEVDGEYPEDIAHMLQHWTKRLPSSVTCVPLMMVDDIPTQFGPLWILGMPFFRKYYSTFKLDTSTDSESLSQSWVPNLVARNMFFAPKFGTQAADSLESDELSSLNVE
jgi:hypothetical protein